MTCISNGNIHRLTPFKQLFCNRRLPPFHTVQTPIYNSEDGKFHLLPTVRHAQRQQQHVGMMLKRILTLGPDRADANNFISREMILFFLPPQNYRSGESLYSC
jgi:hypothetical protein